MSSSQEGPLMSFQAVFVTSIGVICSVLTIVMNIYFIKRIGKTRQKMILFFYRLFIDAAYGVLACAYLTFCILYSFFTEELRAQQVFIIFVGFPLQTAGAMRMIVAVAISLERVLAIHTPIMIRKYRDLCPSVIILLLAIGLGMLENLILHLFCTLHISAIPRNCGVLRCAVDACFFDIWTVNRSVVFALNFAFSGVLSTKLLIFHKSHRQNTGGVHWKVNHLAMVDAANVFLCNFFPTSISNYIAQFPFSSFKNIGPYVFIIKLIGSAVESYFIFKILQRRSARSSVVIRTWTNH
ncbi:Serpentine Receptor, class BC (Class B-like) [Caenorhabditis elegans]|uniref:Serpentine Receptor, class BC (Class B-like) n=1 Tax=Caenorhabditis elegans TaxID=6239 RepID=O16411_CAEEL|nr:Serpentine Receptor, class BC (Class B-like) [Caenorhabditis elegans]CCD66857.1 Serpentine Receptor, class BC (Class B-like) [Caenorhabditis elegans]|eukprot:NP_503874.2 Serpentine Receptor, class BC (class B-like) [Caenorhabditis elegans]